FGHCAVRSRSDFHYTHARLSEVVEALIALIDPHNWTIDSALLARPGVDEIMLDLLYDIGNNWQPVADARQFFKGAPASGDDHRHQLQVSSVWGVLDCPKIPERMVRPVAYRPPTIFPAPIRLPRMDPLAGLAHLPRLPQSPMPANAPRFTEV